MKLVLKYLKLFAPMVVISVVLIFVQTIGDLLLPNYMSDIINKGIMSGGITESVPRVMSTDAMRLVTEFSGSDDALYFEDAYSMEASNSESGRALWNEFPGLAARNTYYKIDAGVDTDRLSLIYGAAVTTFANYMSDYYVPFHGGLERFDVSAVDDETFYSVLIAINRDAVSAAIEKTNEGEPATRTSTANSFTRRFYEELGMDMSKTQQDTIFETGTKMLLISLMVIVSAVVVGFLSARISTGIGRRLRYDIFKKVESFLPAEFDKFSTASLITRSTNDVQQVQMMAMMSIRAICAAPIMGIGGIIFALGKSVSLSWIIAVSVIILVSFQILLFRMLMPRFRLMQKLTDKLNRIARESLTGMHVIRAFGNEEREKERYDETNTEITGTQRFTQRIFAIMQPTMNLVMSFTTLTIVWLGSHAIAASNLQIGDMMAFMQYVMQIIMSFLMLAMMFIQIPRAMVSATRIREVLDTELSIKDKPENELKTLGGRSRGKIEFKNVSFKYLNAEACVIENISFVAKPGEMVAFIGSTGSGKSTLINLIPRFYDVTEGSIEIDGIDIRDISQIELRENLGYIPQKAILFSGDIWSNMTFGKEDATDDDMWTSLKVAQAEEFVTSHEEGLLYEISQGGSNVSGGQKQRMSIARALVKNPPIFIFDDSFSALDFKTDAALRRALREHTSDATVLVVAQRVGTIMNADRIIVLDSGKIVGMGTHRELLETCAEYKEIANSQLTLEELA